MYSYFNKMMLSERGAFLSYSIAILISIFIVFNLYTLDFVLGDSTYFTSGDAAQHAAGALFYLHDSWHFPLLLTRNMNWPEGINIAYMDSIPLAGLFFKLLKYFLPANFHYIGLWHVIVFLSQAIAVTYLFRALNFKSIFSIVIAVIFCLVSPPLLFRLGHTALMTHSLLIFSFSFYINYIKGCWSETSLISAFSSILVLGLLIHPYFVPMIYPIFIAAIWRGRNVKYGFLNKVYKSIIPVVIFLFFSWFFGYIGTGISASTGGFGIYSFNLSSPFCGGRLIQCDFPSQQYEGFSYFGLGLIFLLFYSLLVHFTKCMVLIRNNILFSIIMLLFVLYAASNNVYIENHNVLSYPLPNFFDKITSVFRASGRFIWPPFYAVLFLSLFVVLKDSSKFSRFFLVLVTLLQIWDTAEIRERVINVTHQKNDPSEVDSNLKNIAFQFDHIIVLPDFGCKDTPLDYYLSMQRLAAAENKTINTGYTARSNPNCMTMQGYLDTILPKRILLVMEPEMSLNLSSTVRDNCVVQDNRLICLDEYSFERWLEIFPSGKLPMLPKPIKYNHEYDHRSNEILFKTGWSLAEQNHRWSNGYRSEFSLMLDKHSEDCRLFIKGFTFHNQNVKLLINGKVEFEGFLDGPFELKANIDSNVQGKQLDAIIFLPDARKPDGDNRHVALAVQFIGVNCGI
ncbi:DUF6311 domain-containing protein [Aeromonas sp. R2-2]|uniref:DUF6311 domain-containing protein n=1 Tax=Aeromonas sp. R2-2 TaxID=3138460 RepID=UPI0034A17E50